MVRARHPWLPMVLAHRWPTNAPPTSGVVVAIKKIGPCYATGRTRRLPSAFITVHPLFRSNPPISHADQLPRRRNLKAALRAYNE